MFPTKENTGGLRVPLVSFTGRDPNAQQEVFLSAVPRAKPRFFLPAVVRAQGRILPLAPKSGKCSGIFTDLRPEAHPSA